LKSKYTILSKDDFIDYLKYLKILLKDNSYNDKIVSNLEEDIVSESEYTPTVYYYDELVKLYYKLVSYRCDRKVIRWNKMNTWKAFLRKYKIDKICSTD
jgi:hypothetical protein